MTNRQKHGVYKIYFGLFSLNVFENVLRLKHFTSDIEDSIGVLGYLNELANLTR